ncbi:probable nucleoporin NUP35 at C-terminar half [Coccomyxa sp. Obi]|nr:probable nucleoporin NUP35 at C-terminar half [Coccomyxa sp. Obi]
MSGQMSGQGGSKEFTSLLFTPRTGDKQGLPDYRSPRPTRSPSTQGYGRTRSLAEGSTPRRRSLTPTGSVKDSLPPPPPSQSMLDAPSGAPAAPMPQPETSALSEQSGYWALRDTAAQRGQPYALEDSDVWVTVFGFQPSQLSIILRDFAKCGDIVQYGNGREDNANWVHIKYSNKYGAQRALQRNGELVSRQLMVGVQLLDKRMRSAALEVTDGASSNDATVALPRPQPQLLRPHRIDASASQGLLPQAERSTLAKVKEFVLGL